MNKSVKIVRAFQVESSIVGWMVLGYCILLLSSVILIGRNFTNNPVNTEQATKETGPSGSINSPVRLQQDK